MSKLNIRFNFETKLAQISPGYLVNAYLFPNQIKELEKKLS